MEIVKIEKGNIKAIEGGITLCLGNFDGIHLGHQTLFIEATLNAKGASTVLLFDENPSHFFPNGKSARELTPLDDKLRLLKKLRLDYAFVVHVDKAFFDETPEEFIADYLEPLNINRIVVGEDYSFGKMGKGKVEDLRKHYEVVAMPLLNRDGRKIATRDIISLLEKGDIKSANEELGRAYEIHGKVVEGLHNGRTIGFPTINLELAGEYVLPATGVYVGLTYIMGIPHLSIINVGVNPTVGVLKQRHVESHIIDFNQNCYGYTAYIEFIDWIRPESKFSSLEELGAQLRKDCETAKELVKRK